MTRLPGLQFRQLSSPGAAPSGRRQAGAAAPSTGLQFGGGAAAAPPDDDRPGFELAFGFLPTVNVGNILGIEDDTGRLLANIFLDPIGLASVFLTGGLTAAGKVAQAAKVLNSSKGFFKATKAVKAVDRVREVEKAVEAVAKVSTLDSSLAPALRVALQQDDVKTVTKLLRKAGKQNLPDDVRKLLPTREELFKLDDLVQAEKRFIQTGGTMNQLDEILEFGALGSTRLSQITKGQRDLIRFKVPGTGIEKTIRRGNGVWSTFDKWMPLSPLLTAKQLALASKLDLDVTDLRELTQGLFDVRASTIGDAITRADQVRDGMKAKIKELIPDLEPDAAGEMLTFFKERGGINADSLQKLGLLDEIKSSGAVFRRLEGGSEVLGQQDFRKFLSKKGWLPAMKQLDEDTAKRFEQMRQTLEASGLGFDINKVEAYITHFWDLSPAKAKQVASKWLTTSPFLNKRKFVNFIEGMDKGFTPRFLNTFDIMREYEVMSAKMMSNRTVMSTLGMGKTASKVLHDGVEINILMQGFQVARKGLKGDWVPLKNERMLKFLKASGKSVKDPHIPKALARDLEAIFGNKFDNEFAHGFDQFNGISKTMSLMFSLFHGGALTESALATLGTRTGIGSVLNPLTGLKEAAKLGFGLPGVRPFLQKMGVGKNHAALTDDAATFWRKQGLEIGTPSDVQVDMLQKGITKLGEGAQKVMPGLDKIPKLFGWFTKKMNEGLWDNFHQPLKMIGAQHKLQVLKKLNPNVAEEVLAKQAAIFINNAFGGQNWQRLMVSPKFKQALHWALLAPDWTISNLRVAGIGTTGFKGATRGVLGAGRNPAEQLTGAYWRAAIPVFFSSVALLNRANSGHWPWENAPGHEFDIELSETDEKGRPQYFKIGKQFREPFRWLMEPEKIFGAKLSPGIREVVEQISKHSTTGFPTDFADKIGQKPMTFVESVPLRIKNFAEKFVPFSFQGDSVIMAFPKSSYTETNAIKALTDAVKGSKLSAPSKREIRDILRFSAAAGHDLGRIKGAVRRSVGDPGGLLEQGTGLEVQ